MHPPLTGRRLHPVAVAAGLLALLAATNRWMSWEAGYRLLRAQDELSYREISRAFPSLPAVPLPEQHAERFPLHYLIGAGSDALGVSVDLAQRLTALAVVVGVVLALCVVLRRIVATDGAFAVCAALFVLNPYTLRYYGLAPGYLADVAFDGAILALLAGLVAVRPGVVVGAVVAATLVRQTALPVALVSAGWILLAPGWRAVATRRRRLLAGAVVVLPVLVYAVIRAVAAGFALDTVPGFDEFTIAGALSGLPGTARSLLDHFSRVGNSLLAALALLAGFAVVARRRGLPRSGVPFEALGAVAVAAAIVVQPALFSPEWAARNESRLSAMAVLPLTFALAHVLRWLEGAGFALGRRALVLVALLAVGSLHHVYTVVGMGSAGQTFALQIAVAAGLLLVAARARGTCPGWDSNPHALTGSRT